MPSSGSGSRKKTKTRSSNKTSRCDSACYNYRTENNYLCNRKLLNGYCNIDKEQLELYGQMNTQPGLSVLSYKLDKIKENGGRNKFCYSERNAIERKIIKVTTNKCDSRLKHEISDGLFAIYIASVLSSFAGAYIGVTHGVKKYNESKKTPYELLIIISDKYIGYVDEKYKESVKEKMKKEINKISPDDIKSIGAYIRRILRNSIEIIERQSDVMAKPYVATLIRFLVEHVRDEDIIDVLGGATCVIPDGGKAYDYISSKYKPYVRFSSHFTNNRDGDEFGFTDYYADSTLHMLMGQYRNGTERFTYFQFEGSPGPEGKSFLDSFPQLISPVKALTKPHNFAIDLYDFIRHSSDFIVYASLWKQKNIGSIGTSNITDSRPKWVSLMSIPRSKPANKIKQKTSPPRLPTEKFEYDKHNTQYILEKNLIIPDGLHHKPLATMREINLNNNKLYNAIGNNNVSQPINIRTSFISNKP